MVGYEWDKNKNDANITKHGIDFCDAHKVYESTVKITLPSPQSSHAEQRWIDMAPVEQHVYLLVYKLRGNTLRCISMRKASKKERRLYDEYC